MKTKIKKGCCVRHQDFGYLYVTGSFRDQGGTVWMGINGKDGVSYQFYGSECLPVTRDEFDKGVQS